MTPKKHAPLFRYIQKIHGDRPWGSVLDAGTGVQSLRWIADLPTESWTAISAAPSHAAPLRKAIGTAQREKDRILIGNWIDPNLLKGEVFDTVVADYLLGAVEGFSPFFQPFLFRRLRPLTSKGLYIKGLEPYVPINRPETKAGQLIWEIGRHRDACVLLSGDVPYREYPAQWVVDQLKIAGFSVKSVKHFDIRHKARFVNAQIDICKKCLEALEDRALAETLDARGEALRAKALAHIETAGALGFGRNYVIAGEPV